MDSTQGTPASTPRSRRVGGEQRCLPLTPTTAPHIPRADPDEITERVLPVLFDELGSAEDAVVLVLDDYHLAECAAVDEQIGSFLRYRPPHVQLVVATRSDPALGVARLRLSDELVEV